MDYRHFFEVEVGIQKIKYRGSQGLGCCPLHDDTKPSFSFNIETGQCKCFSGCWQGNAYLLAKELNMENPRRLIDSSTIDSKNYISPPYEPKNTVKNESKEVFQVDKIELLEQTKERYRKNHHKEGLSILGKDKYIGKDDNGKLVWLYPLAIKYHKSKPYWHKDSLDKKKQILGLDELNYAKDTLYICEGEKDWYDFPSWENAVTFSAGADAIPDDLSPIYYDNLKIVAIPYDNDKSGKEGAKKLAKRIKTERPDLIVRIVQWGVGYKDGYDISDAIEENVINEVLANTKEYHLELPKQLEGFTIMTGDDLNDLTPRPTKWIVENLLPEKFNCIVAGTTGSKKSMWSMELGLRVANGETKYLGNSIPKLLKVLYVDTECGENELQKRYIKMTSHMNWSGQHNWAMISKRGYVSDIWNQVDEISSIFRPDLVVIDCLYLSTVVGDFSKANGMSKVTDAVTHLREKYDNTYLLVHHFNKGGHELGLQIDRMSGSSVLQNWVEWLVLMTKTNVTDFHLWKVGKTRGTNHDESIIGLTWDDYRFSSIGIVEDEKQFLISEQKKSKWQFVLEDCPEHFTTEEWLNVFNSKHPEMTEKTGKNWLREASGTPMIIKVKHGHYKKGLQVINENSIEK